MEVLLLKLFSHSNFKVQYFHCYSYVEEKIVFDGKINMGFSCEVPAAHSFNKAAVHNVPVECKILRVIVLIFEQFFLLSSIVDFSYS